MQTIDTERIVLGLTLRYGKEAAQVVLPYLTADKFLFSRTGTFGNEHAELWQIIRQIYLNDSTAPSPYLVGQRRPDMLSYAELVVGELVSKYNIFGLDTLFLDKMASRVDAQGVVYQFGVISGALAHNITDMNTFTSAMSRINDLEAWSASVVGEYSRVLSLTSQQGYQHIGDVMTSAQDRWQRIRAGEQLLMIDSGMPTLRMENLFPLNALSVIHGESGSGKSSFGFQVLLGSALTLKAQGIAGCVAVNSLEMSAESLTTRMASILARVNVAQLKRNTISDSDFERLMMWAEFVKTLPIYIDSSTGITTDTLNYRASGLHITHGPIWQLLSDYTELFGNKKDTEELRVANVVREHFNMAHRLGTSVLVISQSTVNDPTHVAGVDGTRHSRGPRQATDVLTELWNPVQIRAAGSKVVAPEGMSDQMPYLIIQKYRDDAIGKSLPFGWIPECTSFFDRAIPNQQPGQEILFDHLHTVPGVPMLDTGEW